MRQTTQFGSQLINSEPQPIRGDRGAPIMGPRNLRLEIENPDLLASPHADAGEPLRFLEMFRSPYFADVSANQCMALMPPELVKAHLNIDDGTMAVLRKDKPILAKSNKGRK